jgi:hypothetical protein
MKRTLLLVGLAVVGMLLLVGIDELSDLTQTRPDPVDEALASVVVFEVKTQSYDGTDAEAAAAQWGVCAGTVGGETREPGIEQLDDTHFRVTVAPAIGPRGLQRLRGCLDDATVDRVTGSFVSIAEVPAS